ncbi:MAG: competence protein ComEC family protein [Bacteroidota bacterium]|nr:competence protein ComEC family protein [Bacteroidota bacterium]
MSRYPILKLLLPYIAGILVVEYLWDKIPVDIGETTLVILLLIMAFLLPLFGRRMATFLLLTGIFLLGVLRTIHEDPWIKGIPGAWKVEGIFELSDEAEITTRGWKGQGVILSSEGARTEIILYSSDPVSDPPLPGDRFHVLVDLKDPSPPANPGQFDYPKYLRHQGIEKVGYVSDGAILPIPDHASSLVRTAVILRRYCIRMLEKGIRDPVNLKVAEALLLGYKKDLDDETRASFSRTGTLHVLAVSGLHVGVIFLLLRWALQKAGRGIRVGIILPILWFYALFTGWSPSVVRAATMFSLLAISEWMGRETHPLQTILVSAFILLCIDPFMLFSLGFQLSYGAVIGIITLQRPIANGFLDKFPNAPKRVVDLACVSLAAQCGTLPLSLFYFHQFPTYFLLSNFIVVPLVSLILYTGLGLLSLSLVLDWNLPLFLLDKGIGFLVWVVSGIGGIPGSLITDIPFSLGALVILYLTGFLFFRAMQESRVKWLWIGLLTLLSFGGIDLWESTTDTKGIDWVVYQDRRGLLFSVQNGNKAIGLADSIGMSKTDRVVIPHFLNDGVWVEDLIQYDGWMKVDGTRIWTPKDFNQLRSIQKVDPHLVIIDFELPHRVKMPSFDGVMILLHPRLKPWEKDRWTKALFSQGLKPIDLYHHGISFTQPVSKEPEDRLLRTE